MSAGSPGSVLALDVGEKRIGVAITSLVARLPRPLTTLDATDPHLLAQIQALITDETVTQLVIGWPRSLDGQATGQTAIIEAFREQLISQLAIPIDLQDEALTSQKAKTELEMRGKTYAKGEIDALAATYILEDWLQAHPELSV
jgi:putative Holliday junction resolvase